MSHFPESCCFSKMFRYSLEPQVTRSWLPALYHSSRHTSSPRSTRSSTTHFDMVSSRHQKMTSCPLTDARTSELPSQRFQATSRTASLFSDSSTTSCLLRPSTIDHTRRPSSPAEARQVPESLPRPSGPTLEAHDTACASPL
eukprot:Skav233684  [mRNA]  locus=scaffold1927:164846:166827:+ [translate_table: standard]